tara:strand:- start:1841 stop:2119 length:279 start_codon:yes stop_codon:yes gene_type:complete
MKVQRVEWHSYQLVYEYDIPDDDITDKYNTLEVFKEAIASDDEDFDDAYEFVMDNYDPEECYDWQYSQIKGGYETDWYADDECIEPRGEPIS